MNTYSEGLRHQGTPRRGASWAVVAVLVVLFVGGLAAAGSMASAAAAALVTGSFALLGVAGWLRGADTRDGNDWAPRAPGVIR